MVSGLCLVMSGHQTLVVSDACPVVSGDVNVQGVFFLHWYPPKKYGKPRFNLGFPYFLGGYQ